MTDLEKDLALPWIILGNVFALVTVYATNGGLILLLWPYWAQSLVIGWYARKRMLALKEYSTDGFKINDRSVEPTAATAKQTANFFALHYGFFHFGYFVFLMVFSTTSDASGMVDITVNDSPERFFVGRIDWFDALVIAAIAFSFIKGQRLEHEEQVASDVGAKRNIGGLMAFPYLRIIPMHLTIILGALVSTGAGLMLFGGLKTLADVGMHAVERHWAKRR